MPMHAVAHVGRWQCAILEMATLEEAVAAFKSEESVLGNRFVNVSYPVASAIMQGLTSNGGCLGPLYPSPARAVG